MDEVRSRHLALRLAQKAPYYRNSATYNSAVRLLLCAFPQSKFALCAVYCVLSTLVAQPFPASPVSRRPTQDVL